MGLGVCYVINGAVGMVVRVFCSKAILDGGRKAANKSTLHIL
jgi:hypothetical protein